jgi:YVTN family beta-propeller protein
MSKLWSKVKQFFYPLSEVEDDTQKRVKAAQKRAEVAELRAKEAENLAQTAEEPAKGTELRAIAAWYRAKADKLHQYMIILLLQKEWRRITAWIQIQKKKKDGQYLTQAGRYLKVGLDSICTDESFTVLGMVLIFLEAEVKTFQDRQAIAYVAYYGSDTVSVIATDIPAVIDTIPVRGWPRGVAITPDSTKVYVASGGSNNVSVIATNNHAVITTIKVRERPGGVAITPDGTKVYMANYGDDTVSVIATDNHKVITTIRAGKHSAGVAIGKWLIWQ